MTSSTIDHSSKLARVIRLRRHHVILREGAVPARFFPHQRRVSRRGCFTSTWRSPPACAPGSDAIAWVPGLWGARWVSHRLQIKRTRSMTSAAPLRVTCMANQRRVAKVQQQMRREISNMMQTDKVSPGKSWPGRLLRQWRASSIKP